jgi:hypothetical protein
LLQHLLVLGVSLAVYAKLRCSAFIASLSELKLLGTFCDHFDRAGGVKVEV